MHATIDFFQSQIGALRLSRCTKLNRFAGSVVLTHKHLLLETIRRAGAPSHATQTDVFAASRAYQRQSSLDAGYAQAILPTSFVLPAERAELAAAHAATLDSGEVERRRWIIKPLKTGRGKGITFSDDVSAIDASLDSVSKVRSPTGAYRLGTAARPFRREAASAAAAAGNALALAGVGDTRCRGVRGLCVHPKPAAGQRAQGIIPVCPATLCPARLGCATVRAGGSAALRLADVARAAANVPVHRRALPLGAQAVRVGRILRRAAHSESETGRTCSAASAACTAPHRTAPHRWGVVRV